MPSPWQERSWQGRGKGEVFFLSFPPFLLTKISDLKNTNFVILGLEGQFSFSRL